MTRRKTIHHYLITGRICAIILILIVLSASLGCSKTNKKEGEFPHFTAPLPIVEWNGYTQSDDLNIANIADIVSDENGGIWALDYASRRLLKLSPKLEISNIQEDFRKSILGRVAPRRAYGRIILCTSINHGFLVYDKTTNLFHIDSFDDKIKTIPSPSLQFSVTVDDHFNIYGIGARFPDSSPHSGKLIITIKSSGVIEESFGNVIDNRRDMFGINFGYIAAYNGKLWVAFYRLPIIRVYDLETRILEKEVYLKFPQFNRYVPVLERIEGVYSGNDKSPINVEYVLDRMPIITQGLVVSKYGVFLETGNTICQVSENGELTPVFAAPTGFSFTSFTVIDSIAIVLNESKGILMSLAHLKDIK